MLYKVKRPAVLQNNEPLKGQYLSLLLFIFIGIAFCFVSRMFQVFDGENVVQLRLSQQAALEHHFPDTLTGFSTNLADDIAIVVADERVKVGDDADRVENVELAYFFVGCNAVEALFEQRVSGVSQDMH